MGYFIVIVFSTFLGSPPELLPIAFRNGSDCEEYLTHQVNKDFTYMNVERNEDLKYLTNITNDKFIVCKKLEYPIPNIKKIQPMQNNL